MKRTEKNKENNISYFPLSIKWGLRVALFAVCVWFVYKLGVSAITMIGIYILIRSVLKIIRISIRIFFSILSILFLIAVTAIVIVFIF
ncbi:MAG: hypothetical protein ACLTWE_01620 [Dysgonomonas mossii]|uniref:hypothetical protein n=1 Tax=Dysgonomonas mossii TaxID=163665 RepID=UPI0039913247